MAIVFRCPECQKQVQVRDDLGGKKVRCPHCKSVVSAPMPEAEEDEPVLATALEDEEEYREERPARARPRREEPRRSRDRYEDEDYDVARSMPASVVVAIVAMSILLALELALGILSLVAGTLNPEQLGRALIQVISTIVIGGLILWGLIVGHRLAWQWGRVLAMLGAVLAVILAIITFAAPANDFTPAARFILGGVAFIASGCLFTITFSLGTRPAKEYFRLRCPSCGRFTSAAADFFFNTAKCKRCGNKW